MTQLGPPVSVLLPCFNNEATIGRTLESVAWADDIVVVDSYSTDRTVEICSRYTTKILKHEYINSATQKNWALPHCKHDWVLQIDSDEALEPALIEEIVSVVSNPVDGINCYRIPRKNFIYGEAVLSCGVYPDYQTRLFRKSTGRFADRAVHAKIEAEGEKGLLKGHLLHHDFKGIGPYLHKLNRYIEYELQELIKKGHVFHWPDLFLKPPAVFLKAYVLQRGIRDGYRGFFQSFLLAQYVFLKYARLWEYECRKNQQK